MIVISGTAEIQKEIDKIKRREPHSGAYLLSRRGSLSGARARSPGPKGSIYWTGTLTKSRTCGPFLDRRAALRFMVPRTGRGPVVYFYCCIAETLVFQNGGLNSLIAEKVSQRRCESPLIGKFFQGGVNSLHV